MSQICPIFVLQEMLIIGTERNQLKIVAYSFEQTVHVLETKEIPRCASAYIVMFVYLSEWDEQ